MPDSNKSNYWDTHRALAAFHVYVHVALFCTVTEQRAQELAHVYGPHQGPHSITKSRRAIERARYLGDALRTLCWQELGLAGKRMIDWLMSVLDVLDPSPLPQGSYIHLLFDRYQREARIVAQHLGAFHSASDVDSRRGEALRAGTLREQLTDLLKIELDTVRAVLSTVTTDDMLSRFNDAIRHTAGYIRDTADGEVGTQFRKVRELIVSSLQAIRHDSGAMPAGPEPQTFDDIISRMIESSSKRLQVILTLWHNAGNAGPANANAHHN
jgi:hypothetical protein